MTVRLTSISTPIGGASWEYTKDKSSLFSLSKVPEQKIKVFISSVCGVKKYDNVRAELKKAIEDTQLAEVYVFEGKGASTLSAESHYMWALEESDICIFLIDNADGINLEVQNTIDIVKKRNIKALYYFCDEISKEKTALEQSLLGANFAKSKTVHKFEELSRDGAQALINDIIAIYHYYCTGRIVLKSDEDYSEFQQMNVVGIEKLQLPTIPKAVLKNVDKCKDYILNIVTGRSGVCSSDNFEKTSDIDE